MESLTKPTKQATATVKKATRTAKKATAAVKKTVRKATPSAKAKSGSYKFDDKIKSGVAIVGKTAKNYNEFALEVTEDVLDASFETAEKWQKVLAKSVQKGQKLYGKQQDLFFDSVDVFAGQLKEGVNRFKKVFSKN